VACSAFDSSLESAVYAGAVCVCAFPIWTVEEEEEEEEEDEDEDDHVSSALCRRAGTCVSVFVCASSPFFFLFLFFIFIVITALSLAVSAAPSDTLALTTGFFSSIFFIFIPLAAPKYRGRCLGSEPIPACI
jgi:hypothetical protein